jgi:hypothetical protein
MQWGETSKKKNCLPYELKSIILKYHYPFTCLQIPICWSGIIIANSVENRLILRTSRVSEITIFYHHWNIVPWNIYVSAFQEFLGYWQWLQIIVLHQRIWYRYWHEGYIERNFLIPEFKNATACCAICHKIQLSSELKALRWLPGSQLDWFMIY